MKGPLNSEKSELLEIKNNIVLAQKELAGNSIQICFQEWPHILFNKLLHSVTPNFRKAQRMT